MGPTYSDGLLSRVLVQEGHLGWSLCRAAPWQPVSPELMHPQGT